MTDSPKMNNISSEKDNVTIVSFYTGDRYYYECADRLKKDCDILGVPHDIVEIPMKDGEVWPKICRNKISFYKDMLEKHNSPIMWVDVDSRILSNPKELGAGAHDVAIFARGFKYIPRDNIHRFARTFHPGYILFKPTKKTKAFLGDCIKIDKSLEKDVTDDFILEEAFRTSDVNLDILLLSPDRITGRREESLAVDAFFEHGDSGNVREYVDRVVQHQSRLLDPENVVAVGWRFVQIHASNGDRQAVIDTLKVMHRTSPEDTKVFYTLLSRLEEDGNNKAITHLLQRGIKNPATRIIALRQQLVRAARSRNYQNMRRVYNRILATDDPIAINFARSRMFRHSLDQRAAALKIPDEARTPLFWWEEPYPGNLGDIINPFLVEGLTGIPPKYAPKGKGVSAIGSVIRFAGDGMPVWGSGTPHSDGRINPHAQYLSVRGPLTRDLVQKAGATCPEVYGDPAWLLPLIHKGAEKKPGLTGLILHYTHAEAPLNISGVKNIDIIRTGYDEICQFLDEMTSCERIISSSLHGIIIAHAYGIPAAYVSVSDSTRQVHGDGIKFQDYFRSVGIEELIEPVDLSQFDAIEPGTLPDNCFTLPREPINLRALLEAAPFEVPEAILERADAFLAGKPYQAAMVEPPVPAKQGQTKRSAWSRFRGRLAGKNDSSGRARTGTGNKNG